MLASEVIKRYEAYCPQELSMEGDVCGLQVGTLQKDIKKVMVALDIREQTVSEAIAHGVDLIIVKHAPIFRPIKDLVADRAQNQIYINLISMISQSTSAIPILTLFQMVSTIGSASSWTLKIQNPSV